MKPLLRGALICLAVVLVAATAYGQGVITDFKTPPSKHSDEYRLPIAFHPGAANPPFAGWAGSIMKVHIVDASEVDIDYLVPTIGGPGPVPVPPIENPFGPRSQNEQSVPQFFPAIHPLAQQSGIQVTPSVNQPLFDMGIHVKGSNPSGNSDVDVTFMFWNIWHIRENPTGVGSTLLRLDPSAFIWVRSSIQDIHQLHTQQSFYQFPTNPATIHDDNGHFLHIPEPVTFHLTGGIGSQFYATFANTATLGIEHVPEPTSAVLLGCGALALVAGLRARRNRRKAA